MFEYQTAISELTGLPVSNASVYEGPSAVGAAAYLAKLANKRPRVLVSRGVHPHSRATLADARGRLRHDGRGDRARRRASPTSPRCARRSATTSARSSSSSRTSSAPSRTSRALTDAAHEHGALVICAADPLTLGVLEAPGHQGVDVCVGEGQSLGNRLDFGGPSFGFFAATEKHLRSMPGRIAGETTDADGRRGFVLTLQTREQHIRREKRDVEHLHVAGAQRARRRRLPELARPPGDRRASASSCCSAPTTRARRSPRWTASRKLHDRPVVREFALRLDVDGADGVERVLDRCAVGGRQRRLRARALLRRARRRAARRDHRAALARGHRPAGRGARRRRSPPSGAAARARG